jgi:hypothetical protein
MDIFFQKLHFFQKNIVFFTLNSNIEKFLTYQHLQIA